MIGFFPIVIPEDDRFPAAEVSTARRGRCAGKLCPTADAGQIFEGGVQPLRRRSVQAWTGLTPRGAMLRQWPKSASL